MATTTRKLYGASTATTNSLAYLDLAYAARIVGVDWTIVPDGAASQDRVIAEVSLSSAGQQATNDAIGVISMCSCVASVVTSGSANQGSKFCGPMAFEVPPGTRVYLHTNQVGTASTKCSAVLHIQPL